ncbi:hypothetical protein TIFTF001_029711 [Ficus carica]|uniref:Uncharacterized protein n=1 Tax=Ficus carica TaxID=3494 RepID=A0AA88J3R3_FICCA|nr:hypothetical protein TIFTF001_029711 [Ficus carica]
MADSDSRAEEMVCCWALAHERNCERGVRAKCAWDGERVGPALCYGLDCVWKTRRNSHPDWLENG